MKTKLILALAVLLVALTFVACGKKDGEASSAASSSSAQGASGEASSAKAEAASVKAVSASAAEAGTELVQKIATSASQEGDEAQIQEPEPQPIVIEGTYISLSEKRYTEERAPYVEFKKDGTYTFRSNLADGRLGIITGTYAVAGEKITLDILTSDSENFLGENLKTLSFIMVNDSTFVYQGAPLGLTFKESEFIGTGKVGPREEVKEPAEDLAQSLAQKEEIPSETMSGLFVSLDSNRYLDERAPQLQLNEDRTFSFRSNLADGRLGVVTGRYTLNNSKLTLDIEATDCDNYRGADLASFSFNLKDANTLTYNCKSIGLTNRGNVFALNGTVTA